MGVLPWVPEPQNFHFSWLGMDVLFRGFEDYRVITGNCVSFLIFLFFSTVQSIDSLYVGCFPDVAENRALPHEFSPIKIFTNPGVIDQCIAGCKNLGHPYAGVQSGYTCFCGTTYDKYGNASESDCVNGCADNSKRKCGGSSKNSVYRTG